MSIEHPDRDRYIPRNKNQESRTEPQEMEEKINGTKWSAQRIYIECTVGATVIAGCKSGVVGLNKGIKAVASTSKPMR